MAIKTLLITPPFTQLNTPYPATQYLSGFLNQHNLESHQIDLSIDLFNEIFSRRFMISIFEEAAELDEIEFHSVWDQQLAYIEKVDLVAAFLRKQDPTIAAVLIGDSFLPKGHRSQKRAGAYNKLDLVDKAKHLATLFIEELGDFISSNIDEFFAFTRYAEQIASSASNFDQLEEFLEYETSIIEDRMIELLAKQLEEYQPQLVGFTIPFPGNLFSALRCAQFIKLNFPDIKVVFGGGYCNTELRSLSDTRVFNYLDYITLDDGEGPLLKIIEELSKESKHSKLERSFILENEKVVYKNHQPNTIFHHSELPAPSYKGLNLYSYLSFLDVINPMHRLWTDGRWNKLTISHGCYWKQCSFCDVSLDYIGNYQNTSTKNLVDKIEKLISETGSTGFHFVDEAAPPKVLKAMAEELLKRALKIEWWTNIRFEKTFTPELCDLMARSGCIAVTGGLEVASDRLLAKMKKGVDIAQVARVTKAFSENNIMVHAYLMYGFPTQSQQETIDSLEIVRQLFENNCIQSAFWHQFTATIHSPIGIDPNAFEIEIVGPEFEGFAQNDLIHVDTKGTEHAKFAKGLNLSLNNYLNKQGLENKLQDWFEFPIPDTSIPKSFISEELVI